MLNVIFQIFAVECRRLLAQIVDFVSLPSLESSDWIIASDFRTMAVRRSLRLRKENKQRLFGKVAVVLCVMVHTNRFLGWLRNFFLLGNFFLGTALLKEKVNQFSLGRMHRTNSSNECIERELNDRIQSNGRQNRKREEKNN